MYKLFMTSDDTTSIPVFLAVGYLFQNLNEAGQAHRHMHTHTQQGHLISQLSYVKKVDYSFVYANFYVFRQQTKRQKVLD
jgi:hypothetical protein